MNLALHIRINFKGLEFIVHLCVTFLILYKMHLKHKTGVKRVLTVKINL